MPNLTFDDADRAMKDEGFAYCITRRYGLLAGGNNETFAFKPDAPGASLTVHSDHRDPTAAINELLEKCRERWPKPHPWDEKDLEELIVICKNKGWRTPTETCRRDGVIVEYNSSVMGDRKWYVCLFGPDERATPSEYFAASPRLALLGAMKEREKR